MEQQQKKILIIEDDRSLSSIYLSRFEMEGFDVRGVSDGDMAISEAINFHPDIILLDVMLPKISGFDVLDILRTTPDTLNIKIIMLSALGQPGDKERAESLGADDYLVKSHVTIGDVVNRVRHHLDLEEEAS